MMLLYFKHFVGMLHLYLCYYTKDQQDGSCSVFYKVRRPGEYFCSIKFGDEHIPFSPFRIFIADPRDGGISEAYEIPMQFTENLQATRESLQVSQALLQNHVLTASIKKIYQGYKEELRWWSSSLIAGCFLPPEIKRLLTWVVIKRVRAKYNCHRHVVVMWYFSSSIFLAQIGRPVTFTVKCLDDDHMLLATVETPSKTLEEASVCKLDGDQHVVRFTPHESGTHFVRVFLVPQAEAHLGLRAPRAKEIDGSPFHVVVGDNMADPGTVYATGEGLSRGSVGNSSHMPFNSSSEINFIPFRLLILLFKAWKTSSLWTLLTPVLDYWALLLMDPRRCRWHVKNKRTAICSAMCLQCPENTRSPSNTEGTLKSTVHLFMWVGSPQL